MSLTTLTHREILPADAPRDVWLAARRQGVGSSEIAALLGLSPYASPYSIWAEKVMGVTAERAEPTDGPIYWGKVLEEPIAEDFAKRNGYRVRKCGLIGHPEVQFALATPDREVLDSSGEVLGLVEVKNAGAFQGWNWEGDSTDDPDREARAPETAIVQLQWQLFVRGLRRGWVAGLVGGQYYHQIAYERDDELIEALISVAGEFWAHVESGTRPAPDGHKATTEALRELYRTVSDDDASVLVDPTVVIPLLAERRDAKAEADAAGLRAAAAQNQLKELVGNHQIATDGDRNLYTWRPDVNGRRRFYVPRGVL